MKKKLNKREKHQVTSLYYLFHIFDCKIGVRFRYVCTKLTPTNIQILKLNFETNNIRIGFLTNIELGIHFDCL